MKKNDVIKVAVESLTCGGDGVAKDENGFVVFVPNTAAGDVISAKILKVKKNYAYGKIEKIISPSPDRIDVDCNYSSRCGGCVFRHVSYKSELKLKRQAVIDAFERIAKIKDVSISEIIGAQNFMRYRNKAILPIKANHKGEVEIGFFKAHTHEVVNCNDCLLQPVKVNKVVHAIKNWISSYRVSAYDEKTGTGTLRHIFVRIGEKTEDMMIGIVINSSKLPFQDKLVQTLLKSVNGIKSVMVNINTKNTNVVLGERSYLIYGKDSIEDIVCGMRFKISLHSFYQVNREQTEKLYLLALSCADVKKSDVVLDLYCGIGTIGIIFANHVKKVIGVESVRQSIKNARQNAKLNKISNIEFILADASWVSNEGVKQNINVVVIDPPRKGCSDQVINGILKLCPEKVIYISCNPSTLARDLSMFCKDVYSIKKVIPVDMFPRTGHVETIVLMLRR